VAQKKRSSSADRKKWAKVRPFRLRVRIVAACHLREVTPREIARQEQLSPATVQYHFGALEQEGWIHVCRKESVNGGIRHYYTADRLRLITDREFKQMNDEERFETSEGVLMHYLDICGEALREKTLDARPDSHLSHTPMGLDQKAWRDLQNEMDRWLERSLEIKVEAEMRLRKSSEEPIPTVVHLGGFEIPASTMEGTRAHH
jgi:DNA-binding transcriptional ArsR family regulator